MIFSWSEFVSCGDGKPSADSECFFSDLQPDRSLLAFVFTALDHANDLENQLFIKISFRGDLFHRLQIFYVVFQYHVEHFVWRQGVLVSLAGAKFGGRWFINRGLWNDLAAAVHMTREVVDHRFGNVRDDAHRSGKVAVERAIAYGQF